MSYILQRFEDHQIENSEETDESAKKSPQVSNRMLCALLRSILAIAQQLEPLPDGKSYSNGFLTQLADGLKSPDCSTCCSRLSLIRMRIIDRRSTAR